MPVTRLISKVPDDIFSEVRREIATIDWNDLPLDSRTETKIFSTSLALHLRVHDNRSGKKLSVLEISEIISCVDTAHYGKFPSTIRLVEWMERVVTSTGRGRIMIVKLLAHGDVGLHVDPGSYFRNHYRFHVPIVTNQEVKFISEDGDPEHMPEGNLVQLLNLRKHGVVNASPSDRIHVIVDLASKDDRFRYL